MRRYVRSTFLKQRRTFNRILLWLAPLVTILLSLLLMRGRYLQAGAYNWWYMLILPGSFTMSAAMMAVRERRKNRHGLFGVAVQKAKLWNAQVLVGTFDLLVTCVLFFAFVTVGGFWFGESVLPARSLAASIVLFVTYAWQVPLWMFLAEKTGVVATVFASLVCNSLAAVAAAPESCWWIPFAIPARMMCVCIHVLPNGLPMESGNPLADGAVIVPAILLAISWYAGTVLATTFWFERREV